MADNERRLIHEHIGQHVTAFGITRFQKEEFSADGYTLEDAMARIQDIQTRFGDKYEEIRLDHCTEYDYGSEYTRVYFQGKRLETDEEMQARLDKDRARRLEREQQDRLEYDRLRTKFEK